MRALALVLLAAACGGDNAAPEPRLPGDVGPRAPGEPPEPGDPAAPEPPPKPALAAAPRIDLLANRARWHLHDRGLVIPVASEGLRKYALEYKSPWGDVREADGQRGRAMKAGKATLTFPSDADGAAQVIVRVRGSGKLTVNAGKKKLGAQALDGTWQELAFDAEALARGETAVTIAAGKGTLIHSVEIVPAGGASACARTSFPPLSPAIDGALGGVPRMSLLVEIPAQAYLVMTPSGAGAAKLTVTSVDGVSRVLLDGPAPAGEQLWALDDFAGALVRLDVESPSCGVTWSAPTIAVAERPAPAARTPAKHVVLLVIDTLRADRLVSIRETRVETPRITAAAARGWVFRENQSMAPSSPPSHATIHTGQIPRVHGATGDDEKVHEDAPVLARLLGDAGFFTGFVGNNDFAMGKLEAVAAWDEARTPYYQHGKDCAPLVAEALEVIARGHAAGERIFLTALPIEPHLPYRYFEGVTEKYYPGPFDKPLGKRVTSGGLGAVKKRGAKEPRLWEHLRGMYDGEVEHVDGCFGALEDGLATAGLADDTAIVITSDHGEGMGERGSATGHAYGLHGELIHVPLIVLGGGVPSGESEIVTSNADIAPTILDLLGLPPDPRMQGQSVLPIALAGGAWPARVIASEYGRAFSIRGGRWRLVTEYDGTATLHDVVADPAEAVEVSATTPMARAYLREAAGLYLAHRVAWRTATWGTLNDIAATSPLAAE